jgi:hypothetical protein
MPWSKLDEGVKIELLFTMHDFEIQQQWNAMLCKGREATWSEALIKRGSHNISGFA